MLLILNLRYTINMAHNSIQSRQRLPAGPQSVRGPYGPGFWMEVGLGTQLGLSSCELNDQIICSHNKREMVEPEEAISETSFENV